MGFREMGHGKLKAIVFKRHPMCRLFVCRSVLRPDRHLLSPSTLVIPPIHLFYINDRPTPPRG